MLGQRNPDAAASYVERDGRAADEASRAARISGPRGGHAVLRGCNGRSRSLGVTPRGHRVAASGGSDSSVARCRIAQTPYRISKE